jgi:hypothetical protein
MQRMFWIYVDVHKKNSSEKLIKLLALSYIRIKEVD